MPRRIYIYRNGASNTCALSVVRNDGRLPRSDADSWRLWMQIGPLQAQRGTYGFDMRRAVNTLANDGYFLFTGSSDLLRDRHHPLLNRNADKARSDG